MDVGDTNNFERASWKEKLTCFDFFIICFGYMSDTVVGEVRPWIMVFADTVFFIFSGFILAGCVKNIVLSSICIKMLKGY